MMLADLLSECFAADLEEPWERELDFQPAFAIAVLQALRDVVLDMETVDPYFDEIRNAREQPATPEI